MKPDFLTEAKRLSADICRVRASIHRFPELGNREFKTAETVEAFLVVQTSYRNDPADIQGRHPGIWPHPVTNVLGSIRNDPHSRNLTPHPGILLRQNDKSVKTPD